MYVCKFSNGLYSMSPLFTFGKDSIEGILTKNINKAALFTELDTLDRSASIDLDRCESIKGCTYKAIKVEIIEKEKFNV